jgi:hypothetical protein
MLPIPAQCDLDQGDLEHGAAEYPNPATLMCRCASLCRVS